MRQNVVTTEKKVEHNPQLVRMLDHLRVCMIHRRKISKQFGGWANLELSHFYLGSFHFFLYRIPSSQSIHLYNLLSITILITISYLIQHSIQPVLIKNWVLVYDSLTRTKIKF